MTRSTSIQTFSPHPNLSREINGKIVRSEIEGGVHVHDLRPGDTVEIRTRNGLYTLTYEGESRALISGNRRYCPDPVRVDVHGSTWGGSMLKIGYIGRGMCLEFRHPQHGVIVTSEILDVQPVSPERRAA